MHYNPIMISQFCLRGTVSTGWPLTWKTGKSQGNIFDEKVREIHENLSKSGKNELVLANGSENVDVTHFVSICCQRMSVTFWYTADKLESGKTV